jgi:glycosyltransferase involved in cell wall biosynthesis
MRVDIVAQATHPHSIGGIEKHVLCLAQELTGFGHKIRVLTSSDSISKRYSVKKNGVEIKYLPAVKIPVSGAYLRIVPAIYKEITNNPPDVVHAHQRSHLTTYLSSIASEKVKVPFVFTEHGYSPKALSRPFLKLYDRLILPKIVSIASKIVSVSDAIRSELVEKYPKCEEKTITIHNAVTHINERDIATFKKMFDIRDRKVILSVARLAEEKGFQVLLKSIRCVVEKFPKTVFVIIGRDDGYRNKLIELSERLGLGSEIVFAGVVEESVLGGAFSCCEVVAIPSLYEPFSTSMLEAMTYGKPIVATNVGGMPEAIKHGKNGLLVAPGKPEELCESITTLLDNRALARQLGRNAKSTSKEFTWSKAAKDINELYISVIK